MPRLRGANSDTLPVMADETKRPRVLLGDAIGDVSAFLTFVGQRAGARYPLLRRIVAVVALLIVTVAAVPHPGRTAADGCHYCRTNCAKWNVRSNARHCHGGSGGSVRTPNRSTTRTVTTPTVKTVDCPDASGELWRGLVVAPECRCTPYYESHYRYPQSVEPKIAERIGERASPYDGTRFENLLESDIEHIIARSEAHDSGLCAASMAMRARFASDLDNLTLATPELNRYEKGAQDASEWLPDLNRCWFALTVIQVRREYSLTIDHREAEALEAVLADCP